METAVANLVVAHSDPAQRARVSDALRARGLQVYAVEDLQGVLAAARQSRLCTILVDPRLLAAETADIRPAIRKACGYNVPLIALVHMPGPNTRATLALHGAHPAPKPLTNLVPLVDLLASLAKKLESADFFRVPTGATPAPIRAPAAPGAAPTILVVEDDSSFRQFLTQALMAEGYRVHAAPSPADALAILQRQTVDLVISDINMPGMDGFELKMEIDNFQGRAVPFIAISADQSAENTSNADAVGAFAFLSKPLRDLDAFYETVRSALRSALPG